MELNGKKRLTEPAKKEKESFLFFLTEGGEKEDGVVLASY